jgi:hypothetical protein
MPILVFIELETCGLVRERMGGKRKTAVNVMRDVLAVFSRRACENADFGV